MIWTIISLSKKNTRSWDDTEYKMDEGGFTEVSAVVKEFNVPYAGKMLLVENILVDDMFKKDPSSTAEFLKCFFKNYALMLMEGFECCHVRMHGAKGKEVWIVDCEWYQEKSTMAITGRRQS